MLALAFALTSTVFRLGADSPDRPNRQPHLAVEGQDVALAYGAGTSIWFAGSHDGGRSFGKPVKVADTPGLALGRHRGPRVAFAGKAIVISAIVSQKGRGVDGDLFSWRSSDRGVSWSGPVPISGLPAAAREGLHSMSASGSTVFATWLDLRSNAMQLYGAMSRDAGASWSENFPIYDSPDGHICECCHPSSLVGRDGALHVMWRNWLGGSRDMWTAASTDGGKTWKSAKVGSGTWKLNACPMDGGGLVLTRDNAVQTVWRREKTVYLAKAGEPEEIVGEGKDPAMAITRDGTWVVWTGADGRLLFRGPRDSSPQQLSAAGGFPVIAGSDHAIAAWETEGQILVQRLD